MAGRFPGTKKTGGRQKGTRNKRSDLASELFEKREFDPLEALIEICLEARKLFTEAVEAKEKEGKRPSGFDAIWLQIAQSAAKDLMPYRYAKLKPLEVDQAGEEARKPLTLAYPDPKKASK